MTTTDKSDIIKTGLSSYYKDLERNNYMKMKKLLSGIMTVLVVLSLTSCSKNNEKISGTEEPTGQAGSAESSESSEHAGADDAASAVAGSMSSESGYATAEPTVEVPAEEPVVFTEEDINYIHSCFEMYSDKFISKISQPFDFSDNITDLNQVLNIARHCIHIVFNDMPADDKEHIEDPLFGEYDLLYNTPQSVEKAIKEKLYPDFDISKYQITDNTMYWNSERQMFSINNLIQADGYSVPDYSILREGQEGNYYSITLLVKDYNDGAVDISGIDKGFFEFERQEYLFRKLADGSVVPLSMNFVDAEAEEKTAFKKALEIADLFEAIKKDEINGKELRSVDLHDMDKDGNLDLVIFSSVPNATYIDIFSNLDKNSDQTYCGDFLKTKSGDWVVSRFESMGTVQSQYYYFANGDEYYTTVNFALPEPTPYYSINGEKVTKKEFDANIDKAGLDYDNAFSFDYNLSDYLIGYSSNDKFYDFIIFCMNNLI